MSALGTCLTTLTMKRTRRRLESEEPPRRTTRRVRARKDDTNANTNAAPSGLIVPKTEPSPGPAGKTPTLDPKVVAVLELNALLLR